MWTLLGFWTLMWTLLRLGTLMWTLLRLWTLMWTLLRLGTLMWTLVGFWTLMWTLLRLGTLMWTLLRLEPLGLILAHYGLYPRYPVLNARILRSPRGYSLTPPVRFVPRVVRRRSPLIVRRRSTSFAVVHRFRWVRCASQGLGSGPSLGRVWAAGRGGPSVSSGFKLGGVGRARGGGSSSIYSPHKHPPPPPPPPDS